MLRFYGHFAAAYGTFWLCLMFAAVVSRSHVNAGMFGFLGFPAIALVYAIVRMRSEASETRRLKDCIRALEAQLARDVFGDGPDAAP